MKQGADWLAWSLHFVFGLFVGPVVGIFFITRRRHSDWIASEDIPAFFFGAALIGAALASFYGDRLWGESSYRVIPPNEFRQSVKSRIASITTGVIGCILVLVPVLKYSSVI